jgi:hypothetical protein
MEQIEKKSYYTIKEFASLTHKSEVTIRGKVKKGEIKSDLVSGPYGPEYQIPESELQAAAFIDVYTIPQQVPVHVLVQQITAGMIEVLDIQQEETKQKMESIINTLEMTNEKLNAIQNLLENQKKKKFGGKPWLSFLR